MGTSQTDAEFWDNLPPAELLVPRVNPTTVYQAQNGNIIIRQQNDFGEDDSIVLFPLAYGHTIVNAIRRIVMAEGRIAPAPDAEA